MIMIKILKRLQRNYSLRSFLFVKKQKNKILEVKNQAKLLKAIGKEDSHEKSFYFLVVMWSGGSMFCGIVGDILFERDGKSAARFVHEIV